MHLCAWCQKPLPRTSQWKVLDTYGVCNEQCFTEMTKHYEELEKRRKTEVVMKRLSNEDWAVDLILAALVILFVTWMLLG